MYYIVYVSRDKFHVIIPYHHEDISEDKIMTKLKLRIELDYKASLS